MTSFSSTFRPTGPTIGRARQRIIGGLRLLREGARREVGVRLEHGRGRRGRDGHYYIRCLLPLWR